MTRAASEDSSLRRFRAAFRERDWGGVAIEILVVIIGVFLGIEAANWNQAREERVEEKRYYGQLIADLRKDVRQLEQARERSIAYDKSAEVVLTALHTGLPDQGALPGFARDIHHAGFIYLPAPTRRTYDELISTGNLGLLTDARAKEAIADYYEGYAGSRQWDGLLRQQQADYWSNTAGILPRRILAAAVNFEDVPVTRAEAEAILARAKNTPRLEAMLTGMAAHQARVRRDSAELEKQAKALIAELEPLAA